jgi:hypothetical protein
MLFNTTQTREIINLTEPSWIYDYSSSSEFPIHQKSELLYIDYTVRCISLVIHIAYFISIFLLKSFRNVQSLLLHHVIFISLLNCAHYCVYIGRWSPSFGDLIPDEVFCTISEIAWISLKFLRIYSIFMLAVYRLLAVYKAFFFRKLNKKLWFMVSIIIGMWLVIVIFSLALKYGLRIPHSKLYCIEGFSEYIASNLVYWTIQIAFIIVPTILVIIMYSLILYKIKKIKLRVKRVNYVNTEKVSTNEKIQAVLINMSHIRPNNFNLNTKGRNSKFRKSGDSIRTITNLRKGHHNTASQIIIINITSVIGTVFCLLMNTHVRINESFKIDYQLETILPIFRIIFLASEATIPITSMIFAIKS